MKSMTMFLVWILMTGGLGSVGYASQGQVRAPISPESVGSEGLEYHLDAVQRHEQEISGLEEKIRQLLKRFAELERQPYMDSKELRRNGIRRQLGMLGKELSQAKEQLNWHNAEVARWRAGPQIDKRKG